MKKIDLTTAPTRTGTRYPKPHDQPCIGRHRWLLADAAKLTQFGVNLLRLPAGQWSSQRHWHEREDEFIYVLEGEVVLVTDAGEETLRAGDCAGFKAGDKDGHHLQNRSGREALILEVGTRDPKGDRAEYPDIDMILPGGGKGFAHRDGTPY
ncbi:MAG: cupin domain-containing protein [Gammaproteobacteria bacterium]